MDLKYQLVSLLETKFHDFTYRKIFEILDTEEYTANSNGIFIKLNDIEDNKILKCIQFIKSIKISSDNYIESEQSRERTIEEAKKLIKNKKRIINIISQKPREKSNKICKPKDKKLYIPNVYKRIQQCMGRKGKANKVEVFKGDSDDDKYYEYNNEDLDEELDEESTNLVQDKLDVELTENNESDNDLNEEYQILEETEDLDDDNLFGDETDESVTSE